jgi:hypothetical protein
MATFVHLAAEKDAKPILRSGIKLVRRYRFRPRGIFAMPVTPNFFITHQWLRELKRCGQRTLVGIYFRLPDDERVSVGHYNGRHRQMTAAQAVAFVARAKQAQGMEVIVLRRVDQREILRVRSLPQILGWRYWPGAHGKRPFPCQCCQMGQYGGRRLLERAQTR